MKLSQKQSLFIKEYLIDFSGTRAAIAAGYSPKTAGQMASENLKKPYIQNALAREIESRCERVKIDSDAVLERLVAINEMDLLDIFNNNDSIKPISDWPLIWRQSVTGIDVSEQFEGNGDDRAIVGLLKKIKLPDKLRAIDLLGKHVDVQAWKEKIEVANGYKNMTMEELIEQRREMACKILGNDASG